MKAFRIDPMLRKPVFLYVFPKSKQTGLDGMFIKIERMDNKLNISVVLIELGISY